LPPGKLKTSFGGVSSTEFADEMALLR